MEQIVTQADLDRATRALCAQAPAFQAIVDQTGPLPLRRAPGGFAGVLKIMLGQQVSTASAAAIWARIQGAGLDQPRAWDAASDDAILRLGFSRPKLRYGRALCAAGIDFQALEQADDVSVETTLTAVTGIGPWTAQIYLLSCLGRADVFPAADLALQESARQVFHVPTRPDAKTMAAMAQAWSPWRSIAARALWSYYRVIKGREGLA